MNTKENISNADNLIKSNKKTPIPYYIEREDDVDRITGMRRGEKTKNVLIVNRGARSICRNRNRVGKKQSKIRKIFLRLKNDIYMSLKPPRKSRKKCRWVKIQQKERRKIFLKKSKLKNSRVIKRRG